MASGSVGLTPQMSIEQIINNVVDDESDGPQMSDDKMEPLNFNTSLTGKMDGLAIYSEKLNESISNEWPDKESSRDSLKLD